MKLFGVTISSARDPDRFFAVLAETEMGAKWTALDMVDYEVCSVSVMTLKQLLKQAGEPVELRMP